MIWMITSIILLIATFFFGYQAVKLGLVLLRIEDAVEDCLDVLDERFANISEILSRPLFHDSPEIRQVHNDIRRARDEILEVARQLTVMPEIPFTKSDSE
jgi:hypothetical protein